MKIKEIRGLLIKELSDRYGIEESRSIFYILIEAYLKLSRAQVAMHLDQELDTSVATLFMESLQKLKNHEPVQYILGETFFYDLLFKVTPSVLIPRQETEELVHWIVKDAQSITGQKTIHICDIGTGSGCIAIALAKTIQNSEVTAIDISEKALKTASENALFHKVTINFSKRDILQADAFPKKYDIIVSNPPYVREQEKSEMLTNVLAYEPYQALFVSDQDPLVFYRKIAELAKNNLKPSGMLYFEINQYLGQATVTLLEELGFSEVILRKDIQHNDRMIKALL